ncbi:helix-turn-helix transcriptional regulator [Massilia sp. LXY-6]|uniref:helix-turn-helix transcriptional regulator n=1 Tax=Massilia sp. LXY-6 TaxID=3379823 RepID=UPI003EE15824
MEQLRLTALRDFAIEYLPRAKRVSAQPHATHDAYRIALYGAAVLSHGSPTASAVELAAARLLRTVMTLSVNWEGEYKLTQRQRHEQQHEAISAANDLCTLTGKTLTWLADAFKDEPAPPPDPAPTENVETRDPAPPTRRPAPPSGINLSTKEAAEYLNVKEQTLHKWASTDTGPLKPVRSGIRRLAWPSDEVIRLMKGK